MGKKADFIIIGNVITMDPYAMHAEAVAAKDGKIIYVGTENVARKLCDSDTKIYDYGKNTVYPGFLEAHCHPGGAGAKKTLLKILNPDDTLEQCVQAMKEYMEEYPEKQMYSGMGFEEHDVPPCASMLDAICKDKLMMCTDSGGHSMWLNSKAMEVFGINKDAVKEWGTGCVRVDKDGNPTGYISEGPVFRIRAAIKYTVDDFKTCLLWWQNYALSNGYTGVYNAGVEVSNAAEPGAIYALEKEGKLKHYMFGGSLVKDNTDTPEEDMNRIAEEAANHNSKHYRLIGAKVFCDGVVEGKTAWLLNDYIDQPGYRGVSRFNDHEKMVRLIKAASSHNMNVHVHTIGDAAIKAWVDAIAEAEEETGNFDMRNALAHLQVVRPEEIRRFGEYNIIAVAGIMWVEKSHALYTMMERYLGKEEADKGFPVKDFIDSGTAVCSHSDYPVSPTFSVPWTICLAVGGYLPSNGIGMLRHADQNISRLEALKSITTNVAYSWHEENRMGSLEIGKIANLTVFDKDFLKDDLVEIENAKCLATFVDGEKVYEAE